MFSDDLSFGPSLLIIVGLLAGYAGAAFKQRGGCGSWSLWRVAACTAGLGALVLAASPPLMRLGHHDLRLHMAQHLLIGMLAPLGLVLAAPMTLVLRTLSVRAARRVTGVLRSRPIRFLSHPVTALILNIGGMYLLYLTPLYALTLTTPLLHYVVHVHFLAAGYLFTWAVLGGPDPVPHPTGMPVRLTVLFIAMGTHALLGKLMYGYLWPRHTPHGPDEIRAAAQLMYYGGDVAEGLLAVALFALWYRRRPHRRRGRRP